MTEHNKATVRRLIEEVLDGGHLEVIDEPYAPSWPPQPSAGSPRSGPASPTSTQRSSN